MYMLVTQERLTLCDFASCAHSHCRCKTDEQHKQVVAVLCSAFVHMLWT